MTDIGIVVCFPVARSRGGGGIEVEVGGEMMAGRDEMDCGGHRSSRLAPASVVFLASPPTPPEAAGLRPRGGVRGDGRLSTPPRQPGPAPASAHRPLAPLPSVR